MFTETDGRCA